MKNYWTNKTLSYEDFLIRVREIIKKGATPCFECPQCKSKGWMYEGTFKYAFKMLKCKCGSGCNILEDFDAPEL